MTRVGHVDDRQKPALTLITPCLNAAKTIGETLASAVSLAARLQRDGLTLEHQIIDGGSVDGTLLLVGSHRKRYPFCSVTGPVAGGPYPAMNEGLARAHGTYSHVLNADDVIWDVDAYADLFVRAFRQRAHCLLGSIVFFRRPSGQVSSVWCVDDLPDQLELWQYELRQGLHYPHPGFICRTDLYRAHGFDARYCLSADYALMQKLLLAIKSTADVFTSAVPIVGMAEGGATGRWSGIFQGMWELARINRELGIHAPAWRRYGRKIVQRYGLSWLQRLRPKDHPG